MLHAEVPRFVGRKELLEWFRSQVAARCLRTAADSVSDSLEYKCIVENLENENSDRSRKCSSMESVRRLAREKMS